MEGVTGSIPVAPTILLEFIAFERRHRDLDWLHVLCGRR
jgi:hypothetical protein